MRYWFDKDCLVTMFFSYWGLGDAATTLTFVYLSSAAAEANVLMRMLIDVHPLFYAGVKLSAAAAVSVLLLNSLGTSRRERGFVALLALSGASLTLWNLAYIHALA